MYLQQSSITSTFVIQFIAQHDLPLLDAEELRIQATGRQQRGCIIPQAVTHSLVLLKIGEIIARNMFS